MRRRARLPLAASLLLLVACTGGAGEPAPAGLAYGEPDPNPATYTFSDTATFAIDAPGYGMMEVETAHHGTAELHFLAAPDGYHVELRFPRFEATFRNPGQGVIRSDESDIEGPVGVELSFTGRTTVVDTPSLSPTLLDVVGPETMVRPFFVRLPGRAVGEGARWVDTVYSREETAGTVSLGVSVVTSTLDGDTMVADRRLLRISTVTRTSVAVTGTSGGVEIEQELEGALRGLVLWDQRANLLVERTDEGALSGTLSMPDTGMTPIPVSAKVRRRVSLRP